MTESANSSLTILSSFFINLQGPHHLASNDTKIGVSRYFSSISSKVRNFILFLLSSSWDATSSSDCFRWLLFLSIFLGFPSSFAYSSVVFSPLAFVSTPKVPAVPVLAQREVGVLVDVGLLRRDNLVLDRLELKYPNRCDACNDGDEPDPLPLSPYWSLLPLGAKAEASMLFIAAAGKQESSVASRRGTGGCLGSGLPVGDERPDAVVDGPQSFEVREDTNGAADSKRRQELDHRRMVA